MRKRTNVILALNWYEDRLHKGLLRYATEHGWEVQSSHHQPTRARYDDADALIILPGNSPELKKLEKKYVGRTVYVGHDPQISAPVVIPDDVASGRMAAAHLLDRRFENLVAVAPWSDWFIESRCQGFEEEVANRGTKVRKTLEPPPEIPNIMQNPSALKDWLRGEMHKLPRPVGIFVPIDVWGRLLFYVCEEEGWHVPEEISVVGCGNDRLVCPYTPVPLSSVDMGWEDVGYQAGVMANELLKGGENPRTQYITPVRVVSRRSTDSVAVADVRVARAVVYINDNLSAELTVAGVANGVGIPLRTLQSAFRRHLGHGIRSELTRALVEGIKTSLRSTDRTASQISDDFMFSSVFTMLRLFKRNTGITTREFRRGDSGKDE